MDSLIDKIRCMFSRNDIKYEVDGSNNRSIFDETIGQEDAKNKAATIHLDNDRSNCITVAITSNAYIICCNVFSWNFVSCGVVCKKHRFKLKLTANLENVIIRLIEFYNNHITAVTELDSILHNSVTLTTPDATTYFSTNALKLINEFDNLVTMFEIENI